MGLQINEFLSLGDSVQTGRSSKLHYYSAEKPSITHITGYLRFVLRHKKVVAIFCSACFYS